MIFPRMWLKTKKKTKNNSSPKSQFLQAVQIIPKSVFHYCLIQAAALSLHSIHVMLQEARQEQCHLPQRVVRKSDRFTFLRENLKETMSFPMIHMAFRVVNLPLIQSNDGLARRWICLLQWTMRDAENIMSPVSEGVWKQLKRDPKNSGKIQ